MKSMRSMMLVIGLVAVGAATTQVNADTKYFDPNGGSGNWSQQLWSGACGFQGILVPPLDDERAVICQDVICTLDVESEIVSIGVESGAELIIGSARTLILNGADSTSTIDGTIELSGEIRIDLTTLQVDHTFSGDGEIVGQQNSAKITIGLSKLLISSITIRGALEIGRITGGTGSFKTAGGLIHADTNGTIKFTCQGVFDDPDASATLYKVSDRNAILQFAMSCNGSPCPLNNLCKANFELIEGKLLVNSIEGLKTAGTLMAEPGSLIEVVTQAATFSADISCGS